MSWEYDLAKMLNNKVKKSENKLNIYIGRIIKLNPLKISIGDGDIVAQGELLSGTTTFKNEMSIAETAGVNLVGEEVLLIGYQRFFALCLAEGVSVDVSDFKRI